MEKRFIKDCRFDIENGIEVLNYSDGKSLVRLNVSEKSMNPYMSVIGGLIFSTCDTAAAFALADGNRYVTQNGSISYFRPTFEGDLFAEARVIFKGKKVAVVAVEVYDDKKICKSNAQFTMMRVDSVRLNDDCFANVNTCEES